MTAIGCATCRFWANDGRGGDGDVPGDSGECRRHAPTLIMVQTPEILRNETGISNENAIREADTYEEDARRIWPWTYSGDWCGDWKKDNGGV